MIAYRNESWKAFTLANCDFEREEVYISNYGRVKKKKKDQTDFSLATLTVVNSFETFGFFKKEKSKRTTFYVHRAVAFLFLNKEDDKRFVIHKNHNLTDNNEENLQWVNQKELTVHQRSNPKWIAARKKITNQKLTEGRVRLIKRKIFDPKRKTRMKMIAKQFGISEMQLYRIKSGENWGHVKDY